MHIFLRELFAQNNGDVSRITISKHEMVASSDIIANGTSGFYFSDVETEQHESRGTPSSSSRVCHHTPLIRSHVSRFVAQTNNTYYATLRNVCLPMTSNTCMSIISAKYDVCRRSRSKSLRPTGLVAYCHLLTCSFTTQRRLRYKFQIMRYWKL